MGASFASRRLDGKLSKAEVKAKFEAIQDADRHDNGHSYSGGLGMTSGLTFVDKQPTFATVDLALNWIQDEAEKWENALCVRAVGAPWAMSKDEPAPAPDAEVWVIGAWCSS